MPCWRHTLVWRYIDYAAVAAREALREPLQPRECVRLKCAPCASARSGGAARCQRRKLCAADARCALCRADMLLLRRIHALFSLMPRMFSFAADYAITAADAAAAISSYAAAAVTFVTRFPIYFIFFSSSPFSLLPCFDAARLRRAAFNCRH